MTIHHPNYRPPTLDANDVPIPPEEQLRQNLAARAEQYRNDRTLSGPVRAAKIARAYAETEAAMADLEAKSASDARMAARRAMRTAFGSTSSDPATFALQRSAMNEVDKIDPGTDRNASRKAAELLDRATSLGDESLANAVGMAAHKNGWSDVLEQFAKTAKPAQVAAINELRQPQEFNAVAMLRYVVPAPSELGSFPSDTSVQRMIDADPTPSASSGGR
jgi:hypothetical protein